MYRLGPRGVEVFLVHPGGPFFARRDAGVWSIPKGLFEEGESPLATARREFGEETGQPVDACSADDTFIPLGSVVQRGGKIVHAWAFKGDWPPGTTIESNTFTLEWPPGSGLRREWPEVDRGAFFGVREARKKINLAQAELIERLLVELGLSAS